MKKLPCIPACIVHVQGESVKIFLFWFNILICISFFVRHFESCFTAKPCFDGLATKVYMAGFSQQKEE